MDSRLIVERIEELQPTPSCHLESPLLPKLESFISQMNQSLRVVYITSLVPQRILNEASIPFWHETRSKLGGMPLDEWEKKEGGPQAWAKAQPHVEGVTQLLKENDGPFFMGQTPSYTDLVWGAYLLFWKTFGDDVFEKFLEITGDGTVHAKLLEAIKPWSERADY
jgi:glutathione S-transferase